jgi:large conductance mechanosensitive channel
MWAEYKAFLFRGNLVDLAVAFILGVAFSAVVTAFTDGIVMAAIAAIFGQPSFDSIVLTVGNGQILIGSFLTALVNFLIVATVLFTVVRAAARFQRPPVEETPAPDTDEVVLLREIRDALRAGR